MIARSSVLKTEHMACVKKRGRRKARSDSRRIRKPKKLSHPFRKGQRSSCMRKLSRVHTTSKYAAQPEQSMFWRSLSIFIGSAVLMVAVFGGSIAGLFAYFAQDLPQVVNVDDRQLSQSTKIYDRTGETLLYKISGEKTRTVVEKDEISPIVRKAFMAAEDDQFYEHWGIQPRAIARAALVNIREGQTVQGGSTITQQFVKNALLTDDRTYVRKLKEAILSVQLELRYSKDEIFTMYLNEIPFGS
ncbi:MAG: hypothetical protein BRC23_01365, partial [Parcubacteria group bacterium SW_4_49_11]